MTAKGEPDSRGSMTMAHRIYPRVRIGEGSPRILLNI